MWNRNVVIKTEPVLKKGRRRKKTSEWKIKIRKEELLDFSSSPFFTMGKMCLQVGQNSKTKQGGGRYHITVISLCQFHIQDFPRPFESIPTDCTLQYYTI